MQLGLEGTHLALSDNMKKPVLILQQLEYEPAALIEKVIQNAGWETETIKTMEGLIPQALTRYSGLVIMGGHMSANDTHLDFIAKQIQLLEWCIHYDFPVLGICLGSQLLAKAAGASVTPSPVRELGWYHLRPTFYAQEDSIFGEMLASGLKIFQWHGETFELPKQATLLATCPEVVNQVFRIKSRLYGIQFHAEMTEELIHAWIKHGGNESAYLGEAGVQDLLNDIPRYLPVAREFCSNMVVSWIKLL